MKTIAPDILKEKITSHYTILNPYLPALFFVSGFLFDILTLGRIDNILTIISHGTYLAFILAILLVILLDMEPPPDAKKFVRLFHEYKNEVLHFLLGALLNAFVIFYFKSSSFANSFLLLLIMSVLLLLNETALFKKQGPALKVAILKLSLISYFLYIVPTIAGETGIFIFFASLTCSSLVVAAVYYVLRKKNIAKKRINNHLLAPSISMLVLFILLYFLKVIPPVPLSLKHIGIYHNIEKSGGDYYLYQQTPKWKFWHKGDQIFDAKTGDRIFLFTKIFSPGGFKDNVFINFQFRNNKDTWKNTDRILLPIVGGREEGYRGYAYKRNYVPGSWRALIETENGLEIGRINFEVHLSEDSSEREFYKEIQ